MRPTRDKTSTAIVQAARKLRQEATPSEEKLWQTLRGGKLAGLKFRRQHPLGRFVLDFFCVEQQLAVEIDGSVHTDPGVAARDLDRQAFLRERGIRVLRVSAVEDETQLPLVLRKIAEAAGVNTSPPDPLS